MADQFIFNANQVDHVSCFLQGYMAIHGIDEMTADRCAKLLDDSGFLIKAGPKPGFRFREMLRQGRDGKIPLVLGASQTRPHTAWRIRRTIS